MNENLLNRIVINQRVMGGKPIIQGTRLTVQYILKLLADGWSFTDIKKNMMEFRTRISSRAFAMLPKWGNFSKIA